MSRTFLDEYPSFGTQTNTNWIVDYNNRTTTSSAEIIMSRAQRIINNEAYRIARYEANIAALRVSIASQQAGLRQLQQQVAAAKERKASAEAALTKEEEEGPAKKQKTHRRRKLWIVRF